MLYVQAEKYTSLLQNLTYNLLFFAVYSSYIQGICPYHLTDRLALLLFGHFTDICVGLTDSDSGAAVFP